MVTRPILTFLVRFFRGSRHVVFFFLSCFHFGNSWFWK
nr:MAG TPA: hypothetical protein [Caudoviricetes sp.]